MNIYEKLAAKVTKEYDAYIAELNTKPVDEIVLSSHKTAIFGSLKEIFEEFEQTKCLNKERAEVFLFLSADNLLERLFDEINWALINGYEDREWSLIDFPLWDFENYANTRYESENSESVKMSDILRSLSGFLTIEEIKSLLNEYGESDLIEEFTEKYEFRKYLNILAENVESELSGWHPDGFGHSVSLSAADETRLEIYDKINRVLFSDAKKILSVKEISYLCSLDEPIGHIYDQVKYSVELTDENITTAIKKFAEYWIEEMENHLDAVDLIKSINDTAEKEYTDYLDYIRTLSADEIIDTETFKLHHYGEVLNGLNHFLENLATDEQLKALSKQKNH